MFLPSLFKTKQKIPTLSEKIRRIRTRNNLLSQPYWWINNQIYQSICDYSNILKEISMKHIPNFILRGNQSLNITALDNKYPKQSPSIDYHLGCDIA